MLYNSLTVMIKFKIFCSFGTSLFSFELAWLSHSTVSLTRQASARATDCRVIECEATTRASDSLCGPKQAQHPFTKNTINDYKMPKTRLPYLSHYPTFQVGNTGNLNMNKKLYY